ncbi:MAG: 2-amino-4-hydroxy-6-hydroxymethyldihydropteridine diphosphokinase, partial [Candidatus Desulforudis sp.]|nr:2-amino-4-hydroxy-6-hydroxymethyldihydropteridine diphosphokinase [Desulforudis sp.]
EIETTTVPRELLDRLRIIEEKLGRVRAERWGPRVIDLDILLYGNWKIEDPDLQIPHPRLADRAFVVVPLAELAPDLTLPGGMKAADLASLLTVKQQVNKTRTELIL